MRCAVILTALEAEFKAVRAHLREVREETHPKGTVYEQGLFVSHGASWDVAIAQIGAGGPGAALEAERAIDYFSPEVAFFVGVAGGLKDVRIGDVVASTKVYAYEAGRAEHEFLPRPEVGNSAYALVQRARAVARHSEWLRRLQREYPAEDPRAFVGPIAAGEKVVTSKRSAVWKFLRRSYGDALAVEMEGHGFLKALHTHPQVQALVIRGISDLVAKKSEADAGGSQELASRHASAFAFEVLARFGRPRHDPRPASTRVSPPVEDGEARRPPEPQRLEALLAWYLPGPEAFSRVCSHLGLPVWQLLMGWTPTDRWQQVVALSAARNRLVDLRRAAVDGFPAAAARPLRDPHDDPGIPGPRSTRQEIVQRLRAALPGSLMAELRKSRWAAEELLGHRSLRRITTAEPSSLPAHGTRYGLPELVRSSELDAELGDPLHTGWIRKCGGHLGPDFDLPLAALALVRLCEERPAEGKAALRRTLEQLDRIPALPLDLTGYWLRWWPAGVTASESWLRSAAEQDPMPDDRYRTMARLSRLERLLLDAGSAPWGRIEEAPSLVWAVRAGLSRQLAALLENLGEERQSVYLRFFSTTPTGRIPLARTLRRLAQIQDGFEALPPEPWATVLRCSLPTATADELREVMGDDERLNLWLPVLPQALSDLQLDALIQIFQRRPSSQRHRLAQAAGARLAAHPDPPAVWSRLRSVGRPWIRIWAQERTPDEPVRAWLAQLEVSAGTDSEIDILRHAWHDRKT